MQIEKNLNKTLYYVTEIILQDAWQFQIKVKFS